MTKQQFKERWESDANGGGITFEDIAKCAENWGINSRPRTSRIDVVRYQVLVAANTNDHHEFLPDED